MTEILSHWEGTPYHRGLPIRGRGAGCVGFVIRALDEVFGLQAPLPFESEWDLGGGTFLADGAAGLIRALVSRFSGALVSDPPYQPLDVIVSRATGLDRHVWLVGPTPNTLWHAGTVGVVRTGIGELERIGHTVMAAFAPTLEIPS